MLGLLYAESKYDDTDHITDEGVLIRIKPKQIYYDIFDCDIHLSENVYYLYYFLYDNLVTKTKAPTAVCVTVVENLIYF